MELGGTLLLHRMNCWTLIMKKLIEPLHFLLLKKRKKINTMKLHLILKKIKMMKFHLHSEEDHKGKKVIGIISSIAFSPSHRFVLKVGVPVMLLRNIEQRSNLCNGTRLQILSLHKRVIEAKITSGGNIGTRAFIPRISLIPSDKRIPFKF
ncbi:putative DNA helicase Pif1 [Helianthus debilis subsp. tardiflorus]